MGFVVFLTIIWFTSRLAQNSEIIAMLAGGMPFQRLFRPYFMASGLLLGLALVLNHSVVPRSNEQKLAFEQSFINKAIHVKDRNLYREVAPGTIAYFRSVNYGRRTGYKFQLEQWDQDVLAQRIIAAKATYLNKDSLWRLVNVGVRDFQADGSQRYRYLARLDTTLDMTVDDFAEREEVVATMPHAAAFFVHRRGSTARCRFVQSGIDLARAHRQCRSHLGPDPDWGFHRCAKAARWHWIALVCRRGHWLHLHFCLEGHHSLGCGGWLAGMVSHQ